MISFTTLFFYFIVMVTTVGLAYISNFISGGNSRKIIFRKNDKLYTSLSGIYMSLCALILIAINVLRADSVGKDYSRYIYYFGRIGRDELSSIEVQWIAGSPGYWVLNKVLYELGLDYHWLFSIIAILTIYFLIRAIKEQSNNWALSLYIFFCFSYYYLTFSMIRQMLAMVIVLYGFKYLTDNNPKRYILIVLLAALFHATSLVCLLIWPMRFVRMSVKSVMMYILSGVLFFYGFDVILGLLSWIPYVSIYSADSMYSRSFGITTILNTFVRIAMMAFCLFFYKSLNKKHKIATAYYNIIAICTVLQSGAMRFNLFGRLTAYFYIAYVVLLPLVFKEMELKFTRNSRNIIRILVILFFALYHCVYYISPNGAVGTGYDKYTFFWQ